MKKTACKQKEKKNRLLTLLLLLLAVVCIFGPLYMTVVIALKSPQEMSHVLALPRHIQWSNFAKAWDMTDYPRKFANTLFITLVNLINNCFFPPCIFHSSHLSFFLLLHCTCHNT